MLTVNTFIFLIMWLFFNSALAGCRQPLQMALGEELVQSSNADMIAIVRDALKSIDCEMKIVPVPLSRSLSLASRGDLDGDLFRAGGLENDFPNLLRVKAPVGTRDFYIFKKKDRSDVDPNNPKSLKGRTTCQIYGNKIRELISKELSLKSKSVGNTRQCLQMLTSNRVDLFVGSLDEVGSSEFREMTVSIEAAQYPYKTVDLYVYLNKKHQDIADKLETYFRLKNSKEKAKETGLRK